MQQELKRNLKFNYLANVADGGFFGMALGFASFSTIIPLFISTMTHSALIIGMIVAMHSLGWQIPQLLVARRVSVQKNYKPMVMILTIHERIPFLGLALIAFFLPQLGPTLGLWLVFFMLVWQGVGGGITANPWQLMINKVIPPEYLATFFGVQGAMANLLASGGAILAGLLLDRNAYPFNYSYSFAIACIFLVFSYFAVGLTREPDHVLAPPVENQPNIWRSTFLILKKDRNFFWLIVGRMLCQFGVMGSTFYAVHVVQNLGASEVAAGGLASVLMIASFVMNIVLGRLADRWSKRGVLEIGAISMLLANGLACFGGSIGWFYLVNIFISIANTTLWTIMMAVALQFGSDEERPLYVGMATTLIAPATAIAPLLGGLLANQFGYPAAFAVSAICGLLAALVFHFILRDPQPILPTLVQPETR